MEVEKILAVDLGLRTGFAWFENGVLVSYRSTHFSNMAALKKSVWSILKEVPDLDLVVCEGGKQIGSTWRKAAEKQEIAFFRIHAEDWRKDLLDEEEQRSGKKAKFAADILAHRLIQESEAPNPTTHLMSDVAEAILIGYWASHYL